MTIITKPYGYLIGVLLGLIIYFTGQAIFFINTKRTKGQICDFADLVGGSIRYGSGRSVNYYACFVTSENQEVKFSAGSNLGYSYGDTVEIIYKKYHPQTARIAGFLELWILPWLYYSIPMMIILAIVTALYYDNSVVVITRKPFKIFLKQKDELSNQHEDGYTDYVEVSSDIGPGER